ncbi:hypothetical protein B4168_0517 [Anoxybacillus flavithermus]|nr:hypothetical protein B4168_0517 [Anoxybacillus flavithermus]OAO86526.1 hypothetical protein GT23_1544 [Parageobacillus thermoglucosidasius]
MDARHRFGNGNKRLLRATNWMSKSSGLPAVFAVMVAAMAGLRTSDAFLFPAAFKS